jgi:hypothetical protein
MQRSNRVRRAATRVLVCCGVLAAAPAAHALPLISELFYDAEGTDDGKSFVELYGTPGASLDGLRLEVVNGADGAVVTGLTLSGVFTSSGLFVVADRTSAGASSVAEANLLLDFDIQNGPDSLLLRSATELLDAVGFGVFGATDVFAGEGLPAIDVPAGASLARLFANVDTGDNGTDFGELAVPTPGSAFFAPVPEPGTASLCALGLVALARRRGAR